MPAWGQRKLSQDGQIEGLPKVGSIFEDAKVGLWIFFDSFLAS